MLADDDVAVLRWPGDAARRDDLIRHGRVRLVVVAPGVLPPASPDGLEDWVRDDDPLELFLRKERLRRRQAARAPAVLDDDGLLRRGPRWVALSPRDLQLATVLLARPGALVGRPQLLAVVSPGHDTDDRRMLDTLVRRLNHRIAPLAMRVHTVRASGFLLELADLPA